jgi:hypothetical protein
MMGMNLIRVRLCLATPGCGKETEAKLQLLDLQVCATQLQLQCVCRRGGLPPGE